MGAPKVFVKKKIFKRAKIHIYFNEEIALFEITKKRGKKQY